MMAFLNSACFFLWAVFLLSFADAAPTPVAEGGLAQSQALDLHNTEAGSSRCYYNFQHYEEGDRIITNEPCLNCTCHKRMLMCYLRVCPFTKPVSAHCTVEKKPDQCCPIITCPEVPVDIVTSSTTEASTSSSSAIGHVGQYGCTLEDNTFYPDGVQMPSDPKKPCELCYCIRNHTACVRQECTLNVEGCRPVYQDGVCCPVRYDCDYNEISTTERPSTGGLLLGTTASPAQQCHYGDTLYNDGELIETDKPCESCYCMRGDIVCAVRSCGEPLDGNNCHALPTPEGQCCPTTFQCANGTISIENIATESSIMMHPSPMETDVSSKEPEPQPTVGGTSEGEGEDTENKDKEADSSTEILPSDSPKGDENQEDKHEEEKVDDHPDEHILSEPTDADDLEEEEALASHPDHLDNVSESQSPDINEQISTFAPDSADKVEIVTQSNIISEVNTLQESAAESVGLEGAELDQEEKDGTTEKQESIKDKVIPDGSESAGTEGENDAGPSEFDPEKHDIVTEIPVKSDETSKTQLEDDVVNEVPEPTEAEVVTQSGESEQPKEPTIEQEPVPAELEDKKEEIAPTLISVEENPPMAPAGEQSVALHNDNEENSPPETHSTGIKEEETKIESNQIMSLAEEVTTEIEQQPEKEDETPTTNENEIKYEETPSKTPESLDQVKEPEIVQEIVDTSTSELPEVNTSEESTASTYHNKQEVNGDKEKEEEVESNPENPSKETEPAAPSEESNPEHSEHFHKEQAPPRKEDASPEELEQRPQHPEGSMTKAEDSIPDGQVETEATTIELPGHVENPEESHEVQSPSGVEKIPVDATEISIKHDGAHESVDNKGSIEGQVQETLVVQTESPITNHVSSEQHEISQTSEIPETPETNTSKDEATEPATGAASSDVVNENGGTTTIDTNPSESPSSEIESVPTVIVIEPESETSTDSLPEESSHGEVKPETVLPQGMIHDSNSDVTDEQQSLQTEKPVETEEETTVRETAAQPEDEKQPAGDINEIDNIPTESTQSSSEVNAVEDGAKEETTEQSSHDENKPSSEIFDNAVSLENSEKEPDSATDHSVDSEILNTTEGNPTVEELAPSEAETVYLPTAGTYMQETEESGQIHSDTTETGGLPNEIKPDEDNTHKAEPPTEPSVTVEESTNTLIKTGSESTPEETESEKNGEESETESQPAEIAENPTPESGSPVEEIHHDPVESEPTEFDDNEFGETGDHDSTSENEIVDDQLSGHGGAVDHGTPSIIPGPIGVIPGEGDCLVDGQTYTNNSIILSKSPCHKECTCISSIVHCQGIDCPAPPPELANCMPVHQGDLCCPVYTCDGNTPEGPQSHNQMGGNEENITETEDHTTSDISPSGPLSSDSDAKEAEAPEQAIKPTDKSDTALTSENGNLSNESETQKEDNAPMEHEGAGSQSGESSATDEDIPISSQEVKPEDTDLSVGNVEKEHITPSPGTVVEDISASSDEVKPEKTDLSVGDVEKEHITPSPGTVVEDISASSEEVKPEKTDLNAGDFEKEHITPTTGTVVEDLSASSEEVKPDKTDLSVGNVEKEYITPSPGTVVEDISVSLEEGKPEKAPDKTELNSGDVEVEYITPRPDTDVEGHEDESDDDKPPSENVTAKVDTPGEDSEAKPDFGSGSTDTIPAEGEKETQQTVLTDQTESHGGETPEPITTETPIFEESPTKPDEQNTVSEQDNLSIPSEKNEQPQQPETPVTETSQTFSGEAQEAEGQKEPEVELGSILETGTQGPSESVDENLPSVTEKLTEANVDSSSGDQVPSEENQPDKELESPSTDPSIKQSVASIDNPEDAQKASEEAHDSNDVSLENEITEHDVQEIATGTPVVDSQDEDIKQESEVTQEPSEPEIVTTGKPYIEETSQLDDSNETHKDDSQSESEEHSKPAADSNPQTVGSGSEVPVIEDVATEMTSRPTESSLENSKPNSEVEGSITDTDETVPSVTSEEEASSEPKPLDEHKIEESKTDDEHKIQDTTIETMTSQSVVASDAEENQESELSNNTGVASSGHEIEGNSHGIPAPEGAVHDDTGDVDITNEEITENSVELQHGLSTEAPSFDGPTTKAPLFEVEHGEDKPLEETKGPGSIDTFVSDSNKTVDIPESDNLIIDDTHVPSSAHQEATQDQSPETSSVSQNIKHESDSDKHETETTEISKHSSSETSETSNEIEEQIPEAPNQEVEQPDHEIASPTHDTNIPVRESSESPKPEGGHEEEETTHKAEDGHEEEIVPVHTDEEQSHSTEIPTEENANAEEESVHKESEPVHVAVESSNAEEETVTEHLEPVNEETEQFHEEPESAHEESEQSHEETEQAHEEPELAHEETEQAHEEPESAHEETEPAHEDTEQAHEEPESAHEVTEPAHEDTEHAHEETEPAQEETEPAVETEQAHEEPETAHEETEPAHEDTEQVHIDPDTAHEETEPAHEDTEQVHIDPDTAHEETEPAHEDTEQVHIDPDTAHEETEPAHEDTEQVHIDPDTAHEETEPAHEDTEQAHEEPESVQEEPEPTQEETEASHEETEQALEVTEAANEVSVHEGESDHVHETTISVNEADQSTSGPNLSENVPQESEHVDEHPIAESEHPGFDSDHVLKPDHQTHEVEQPPDENTIGEGEQLTHESGQGIHEQEQTIHETEVPHTQDSGTLATMPGATHTIDDSKPQHSKPDDSELPPEEQFTPDVDMDYDVSEDGAFGPGTCRYGGKVYVSAQQIPRDDPCDFCFCFRSDIICLQQSCPPPIHRCHQEPIQGYCCPRYQCPVSMATSLNVTTTTSTTTTTLPPHFFAHAYRGAARQSGCFHRGRAYEVGEEIVSASGPCLQCICGSDGQMRCDPKVCNPEPMVRKLMEAAVSHRRR